MNPYDFDKEFLPWAAWRGGWRFGWISGFLVGIAVATCFSELIRWLWK